MSVRTKNDRDARLVILMALREEPNHTAKDSYLAEVLKSAPHFIVRSPRAVRQYCVELEEVGGVKTREIEGVFLATLAEGGILHLDEVVALQDVTRVPELR